MKELYKESVAILNRFLVNDKLTTITALIWAIFKAHGQTHGWLYFESLIFNWLCCFLIISVIANIYKSVKYYCKRRRPMIGSKRFYNSFLKRLVFEEKEELSTLLFSEGFRNELPWNKGVASLVNKEIITPETEMKAYLNNLGDFHYKYAINETPLKIILKNKKLYTSITELFQDKKIMFDELSKQRIVEAKNRYDSVLKIFNPPENQKSDTFNNSDLGL